MNFMKGPVYDMPTGNEMSERERILKLRQQGAFANKPQSPVVAQEGKSYFAPAESFMYPQANPYAATPSMESAPMPNMQTAAPAGMGGLLAKFAPSDDFQFQTQQAPMMQLKQLPQMGGRYQRKFQGLLG